MIAFLKGKLHSIRGDAAVVEVNGVGYSVQVPLSLLSQLPPSGDEVMLHTFMSVREDGMSLYGFDTLEALDIFSLLLNVSGIGPRGALSLLSVITPGNLVIAVKEENVALLTRAPGIGKKSAQRIILELKDKLKVEDFSGAFAVPPIHSEGQSGDAIDALVALGYNASQAAVAVERAGKDMKAGAPTAELVRQALRLLADSRGIR
ncbi:MAG: Holliday junction branch migration protein RuvA [Bacillota bacterium]